MTVSSLGPYVFEGEYTDNVPYGLGHLLTNSEEYWGEFKNRFPEGSGF